MANLNTPSKLLIGIIAIIFIVSNGLMISANAVRAASSTVPSGTLSSNALKKNFNIGTLMNECFKSPTANSMTDICKDTLISEYSGMTLNLDLEWKDFEAEQNQFSFTRFDNYAAFAKANNMTIHLSHLVWARNDDSYPDWLFQQEPYTPDAGIESCGNIDSATLAARVHNHIKNVVQHLEATVVVVSYNVDNESIDEDGNQRQHCFYKKLGPDYAVKFFQYARKFAPTARLMLNENFRVGGEIFAGGINLTKVDGFFTYVSHLKSLGAPLDAVGIQNHLRNDVENYFGEDYQNSFKYILQKATAAGVKLAVTEMDVYQGHKTQDDVARVYKNTFKICYQDLNCVWFNTWGISDAQSWLRKLDVPLLDAQPLLFDEIYQKKSSYNAILEVLYGSPKR